MPKGYSSIPYQRGKKPEPPEVRFWRHVNKDGPIPMHCPELGPCWIYSTGRTRGSLSIGGRKGRSIVPARFSWELHYGTIPAGKDVCHHCDNGACVRPRHLFLGTDVDNTQDAIKKGRHSPPPHGKGEANSRALLTEHAVRTIRRMHASGVSQTELAEIYGGLTPQAIWRIVHYKSWAHVP
jgi:hypothetical protein